MILDFKNSKNPPPDGGFCLLVNMTTWGPCLTNPFFTKCGDIKGLRSLKKKFSLLGAESGAPKIPSPQIFKRISGGGKNPQKPPIKTIKKFAPPRIMRRPIQRIGSESAGGLSYQICWWCADNAIPIGRHATDKFMSPPDYAPKIYFQCISITE